LLAVIPWTLVFLSFLFHFLPISAHTAPQLLQIRHYHKPDKGSARPNDLAPAPNKKTAGRG
jgi:hypothetical protein